MSNFWKIGINLFRVERDFDAYIAIRLSLSYENLHQTLFQTKIQKLFTKNETLRGELYSTKS